MRDPKNRRSERELPRFVPLPCAPLPELELEGRGEKKEAFSDRTTNRSRDETFLEELKNGKN